MRPAFLLFAILLLMAPKALFGQDSLKLTKPVLSFYGFARGDAIIDTRQITEAREGYLLLYPKNAQFDRQGKDLNAHGSFNQYSMAARMGAKITGPDVLSAKVSAVLEADFTGASNSENNSFRLRHAYARMNWKKVTLLSGQYWHPLDVPEMLPEVLSLNTGAPYHSYSRQPQIRLDFKAGSLNLVGAVSSQRDYVSNGPAGNSSVYLRNSLIPNLHAQIQYKSKTVFSGVGADFKRLVPRLVTDSLYSADESINSFAALAFLKVSTRNITVKAQLIYGQNLNDHLMLGGYAVSSRDTRTDRRMYQAINTLSGWINIMAVQEELTYSLFAGYSKSLGTNETVIGPVYARDPDLDYSYRVAPMVSWSKNRLNFTWELEITAAAYGVQDDHLRFSSSETYFNIRNSLALTYSF